MKSSKSPKRKRPDDGHAASCSSSKCVTQVIGGTKEKRVENVGRKWTQTRFSESLMNNETPFFDTDVEFSVMCYNVLADYLARRHPELYEGSGAYLEWEARFGRLVDEIRRRNADILCLQEVQDGHYGSHFTPALARIGYAGVFKRRTGDKLDGCAIFYKPEKFDVVESDSVEYFQPGVRTLDRDNIGVMAKFRARKNAETFCICNTHLLFNPKRTDVRLAQMAVLLAEIDRFAFDERQNFSRHRRPSHCPVILAGDFNSDPTTRLVKDFIMGGHCQHDFGLLLPEHLEITDNCQHVQVVEGRKRGRKASGKLFHSDFPEETHEATNEDVMYDQHYGTGVLGHGFGFKSAYQSDWRRGAVTTKQGDFVMVDFIFYSTKKSPALNKFVEGKLKLLSRLQLHSGAECHRMGGRFPNEFCPSDHLCLIAKFLLRKK